MYFPSSVNLVRLEPPIFVGYVEGSVIDPVTKLPAAVVLTKENVESIRYFLSRRQRVIRSAFGEDYIDTPVADQYDIPISPETIVAPQMLEQAIYDMIGESPFVANFVFFPDQNPPFFTTTGLYNIRFEFTTKDGKMYPAEIDCEVK